MTRLLFLNPIGGIGGAERVLLAAVRQVRRQRPDLAIAAVLLGGGPLEQALAQCDVDVRLLPLPEAAAELGDTKLLGGRMSAILSLARSGLRTAPGLLRYSRRLRSLLQSLKPDLIHSNGLKSHLLLAFAAPPDVPVIWHVHDFYSQRPLMANLLRRLGRPARAIAISNAVKADVAAVLPGVPTRLIYNSIDTAIYSPGPGDPAALDALAGFATAPSEILRIGLVATYANWKGQAIFLQAAARMPPTANLRFFIIGGPIYRTLGSQFSRGELQAMADSLGLAGRVGFVPFQPDPANVYRTLDIVVHASTRPEPFGLTIAEAMACGRAVIVSAGGGARELFTDGVDAVGHIPGNVDSLVSAMKKIIDDADLRRRLGENGRRTATERFAEEPFGRELLSLYDECLAAPPDA